MNIGLAVQSVVGLFALWVLVFFCWRSYRVDRLRDELFQLRNELFDDAADGKIRFDEPAYLILRNTMNGLIRGAEHFSFFRYLIVNAGESTVQNSLAEQAQLRWRSAVARLTPEQKRLIDDVNRRLNVIVVNNLVEGSPFLMLLNVVALAAVLLPRIQGAITGFFQRSANVIEAQALAEQELACAA